MASNSTGKNSTGKWVERAATTGGGRTYRGQMPVNWYASLVVICIVGLLLDRLQPLPAHPQTASSAGPPTTSQVWHAALGIDICGKMQPNLPASTNTKKTGLDRPGQRRAHHRPAEQLGVGEQRHPGQVRLRLQGPRASSSTLQYPGKSAYSNGDVCPKGTPDSGKPGVVIVDSWTNFESKGKGTETSGPPQDLLFANGQLITMAFVPATASVPKPPASVITNLLTSLSQGTTTPRPDDHAQHGSTTATTGATTSTTAPTTTPTTAGSTTPTTAK